MNTLFNTGCTITVVVVMLLSCSYPAGAECGHVTNPDDVITPAEVARRADAGDAEAIYQMGMLYEGSQLGTDWLFKAARKGHPAAQNMIGLSYAHGCRVPEDNIQAYFWFSLAMDGGNREAQGNRDFVAGRMTDSQIRKAHELYEESRPEKRK